MIGGIIHKPMFERLILCEYAVADLTTANANVFYELGIRHAVRQWSTIPVFAEGGGQLPFDVATLRAIPYKLSPDGTPAEIDKFIGVLVKRLVEAKKAHTDSPIYQLVEGFPEIKHTKTDVFRERVEYATQMKEKLSVARKIGVGAVRSIESTIKSIDDEESGVVIDLFLSYRSVKAWDDMITLVKKMSVPLSATVMVQEQLAFALNRAGRTEEAEKVLLDVLEKRGPSSETLGLLGRIYKDRWEVAQKNGEYLLARGFLEKAIDSYLRGFESDWRDAYPGVNAVTLMELKEPPDPRRKQLIPVVNYSVERRIAAGKPDYWDHATLIELAILGHDESKAMSALCDALASVREKWEPETTVRNLRLIREARERRNENVSWAFQIEEELVKKM